MSGPRPYVARRVPVETLRAEIQAAGVSHLELARRLGWRRPESHGGLDGHRVRRVLGLLPQDAGHGYGMQVRKTVNSTTAAAIRKAIQA